MLYIDALIRVVLLSTYSRPSRSSFRYVKMDLLAFSIFFASDVLCFTLFVFVLILI